MTIGSVFRQAFTNPCWDPSKELPDLSGKVALITGASTGLGKETALQLARKGAHVFCLGRSPEKTLKAIEDIKKDSGNPNVEFLQADLMDLKSVQAAADTFLARNLPLHILVNNAGIMATPYALSKDGIESQMATNHFSHVLLTNKLLPLLIESQPSRIVNLSSLAHEFAPKEGIHYEELNDKEKYDPWVRYSESKLANIHFTRELHKRLDTKLGPDHSVLVNAVHPGGVETELDRNLAQPGGNTLMSAFFKFAQIDTKKGALTQIFVAASKDIQEQNVKGKYFVPFNTQARPIAQGTSPEFCQLTWDWTQEVFQDKFDKEWTWAI